MDTSQLPENLRCVILCCKAEPTAEDIEAIRTHVKATEHLEEVSMLAYEHSVYPLFYLALMKHASDLIDGEMKDAMAYLMQTVKVTNENMTRELIELYELLSQHNLTLIPYKGPVLSELAYGSIFKRQYSDIDAIIDEKHLFKIIEILKKNNYKIVEDDIHLKNKTCYKLLYDFRAIGRKHDTYFELHWKFNTGSGRENLSEEFIKQNLQIIKISNKDLLTFNNELYLAYLCLHGNKHAWERLLWIADIDRLIRACNQQMDFDKAFVIAKKMQSTKTMLLGLNLAKNLFGTPINWNEKLFINKTFDSLSLSILHYLSHDKKNQSIYAKNFFITFHNVKTMDTFTQKIRFLSEFYFGTKIADCVTLLLPDKYAFLYPVLKPFIFVYRKIIKACKKGNDI